MYFGDVEKYRQRVSPVLPIIGHYLFQVADEVASMNPADDVEIQNQIDKRVGDGMEVTTTTSFEESVNRYE